MTRYAKGRAREYRAIAQLKRDGYDCIRAAGSHGMFDVVAWREDEVRLIQVKAGTKASKSEREAISECQLPESVHAEIWFYTDGVTTPNIQRL